MGASDNLQTYTFSLLCSLLHWIPQAPSTLEVYDFKSITVPLTPLKPDHPLRFPVAGSREPSPSKFP